MTVSEKTRNAFTRFGLWLPNDLYDYLCAVAKMQGAQMSAFLREILRGAQGAPAAFKSSARRRANPESSRL